jgi:hypothetical protein
MVSHQTDWEKNIIDNADSYCVTMWRPLGKTTKTIVKTYDEAKKLYKETMKRHTSTLVYAICNNDYANINHLEDFKTKVTKVKYEI